MTEFKDVIDSLDSVAEEYRVAYEPDGDKFKLRAEYKPFAVAITGLNTTLGRTSNDLKKAQGESASRRQAIQAFEDFCTASGVTVAEGKTMTEALKEHMDTLTSQAKNGGELKVSMDNIRREFEKKTKEIQDAAEGKIGKMNSSLERYLIGQQATAAIAKHKGTIELVLPIVRQHVKVVPDGEDYVVRVVDADGNVRTDGKGGFLDVDGLVQELKINPSYARAFESENKGGSGTQTTTRQQFVRGRTEAPKSAVEKIRSGLSQGLAARKG